MVDITNFGLKHLVSWGRLWFGFGTIDCTADVRDKVNTMLGPNHKLDEAAFDAICLDLDNNPLTGRPSTSAGKKRRDDPNFNRVVEEAFKEFRDQEREIILAAPGGSFASGDPSSWQDTSSENCSDGNWWLGAARLRHYIEFLLTLKGVKPCVLFLRYTNHNNPLFSTVVIDCLVPIMDRFDLWSYGFGIGFQGGCWVFYDAQSQKMPLIAKAYLVHETVMLDYPDEYDPDTWPGIPDSECAEALGYPVPFDNFRDGNSVVFVDDTEMEVLATRGRPEDQPRSVLAMSFNHPASSRGDISWTQVLAFWHTCRAAARSVGTDLALLTDF